MPCIDETDGVSITLRTPDLSRSPLKRSKHPLCTGSWCTLHFEHPNAWNKVNEQRAERQHRPVRDNFYEAIGKDFPPNCQTKREKYVTNETVYLHIPDNEITHNPTIAHRDNMREGVAGIHNQAIAG